MADVGTLARTAVEKANPAKSDSPLAGPKGLAAGAAVAALPFVLERVSKLVGSKASDLGEKAKESASDLGEQAKDAATDKLTPDAAKGLLGGKLFGRDGDEDGGGEDGSGSAHGSGRRMPIQQSVDVAVPVKVAYNRWTQFEEWPQFMHRVENASQVDDATVSFETKVWGVNKQFEAQIMEQRPDERIEWDATEGLSHTGVATFHKLSDRLTRIEVTLDVQPNSLVEKFGRGARYAKRAVRGDLHRFKAFVELEEEADGGWRGTIEDGEVKRRTERKPQTRSRSKSNSKSKNSSKSRNGSKASK